MRVCASGATAAKTCGVEGGRLPRRGRDRVGAAQPGRADRGELLGRERPDVVAVERPQLLDVEERRRVVDLLDPVLLLDHRPRHDLPVAGGRPAEQHQVVAHGGGQVALVAVGLQGDLVAALGQLLPLLVDDDRDVRPDRRGGAQRLPEQLLLGGVGQVLLGADHVGDPHGHVVDDVGQQEHRRAVAAGDDEVLEQLVLEGGLAADQVDHHGLALVGRAEAQRAALARAQGPVAAEAVVAGVAVAASGRRTSSRVQSQ